MAGPPKRVLYAITIEATDDGEYQWKLPPGVALPQFEAMLQRTLTFVGRELTVARMLAALDAPAPAPALGPAPGPNAAARDGGGQRAGVNDITPAIQVADRPPSTGQYL